MHPSSFLLALVVFVVPTHAIIAVGEQLGRSQALYALNALQSPGTEYGRFYDASPRRAWAVNLEALTMEKISQPAPPLTKKNPDLIPFVLDVPAVPPAPFQRTFHRLMTKQESRGYDDMIRAYADKVGLDPRLVKAVIAAESEFTARAKSPAGALGLMQIMPATAGFMGVSGKALFDPEENIRAGTLYLAYLYRRAWLRYHLRGVPFSRAPAWLVQRIVAAYNAGPRFLQRRRLYTQTREYVKKVLLFYRSRITELRAAT